VNKTCFYHTEYEDVARLKVFKEVACVFFFFLDSQAVYSLTSNNLLRLYDMGKVI
jgi:hypothetical protein